jgi:hypothetical protein
MATPFIAGTVTLGLEARRRAFPTSPLTPLQVRGLLESSALDRGPQGKDNDWGAGLVDAAGGSHERHDRFSDHLSDADLSSVANNGCGR